MKIFEEIGRVAFGDMTALFFLEQGKLCFTLIPAGMEEAIRRLHAATDVLDTQL